MPHDIVVSKNGSVFVADVDTNSVIKFMPGRSKFKSENISQIFLKLSQSIWFNHWWFFYEVPRLQK